MDWKFWQRSEEENVFEGEELPMRPEDPEALIPVPPKPEADVEYDDCLEADDEANT